MVFYLYKANQNSEHFDRILKMSRKENSAGVLLPLIVLSVVFLYFAKYIWRRRWLYYYASKLDGPFALPFIGSVHLFREGPEVVLDKLIEICQTYKRTSVAKLWLGPILFVVPHKLDDVQKLLTHCLDKPPFYDKFVKQAFGESLLVARLDIWKRHRKVISLTFNQKILNSFISIFADHSDKLVNKLDRYCGKGDVDVLPLVFQTTLSMICGTSLGTQVKEMNGTSQYMRWIARGQTLVLCRFFRLWLHSEHIWKLSAMSKEFGDICNNIWDYVGGIVETKRYEKSSVSIDRYDSQDLAWILPKRKNFIDLLLDITDNEERWKKEELVEEAHMMVFAGSETSALIQSSAMVMLAMHQEIQERAYEEIVEIFGDTNRIPEPEDLTRMVYLERVIKETLRLFPVASFLLRSVEKDIDLENCRVPKGSHTLIPCLLIQRSPEYWKDPLKFDPDRFLPEEVAKRHKCSFLPFSFGPRDCIGKRYAMMSMKTVLSTILRNFRLVSTPYKSVEDVKLISNVMTIAKSGYNVKIERRMNEPVV